MWIPDRDIDGNIIVTLSPFASKKIPGGSLFKRVHGLSGIVNANSTANIDFVVPYAVCKFNGAEIIGCKFGDLVDFTVHDTANNDISGLPTTAPYGPNIELNKFGHGVFMPAEFYENTSEYDADLFQNMIIRCTYTNNTNENITIGINFELHEVKQ